MIRGAGFLPRLENEERMWTETDPEVLWQQEVDGHVWENNGQPACLCQEEWDELLRNTSEKHHGTCVFLLIRIHWLDGDKNDPW